VKLPDKLRGTDVTDGDGPFDSLLPGLETSVDSRDLELSPSSHRLVNSEADRVGSDIGFGGSLKNVLRLSLTDAAISLEVPPSLTPCRTSGKSKDMFPLDDTVLANGGVAVGVDDVVVGGDGRVVYDGPVA